MKQIISLYLWIVGGLFFLFFALFLIVCTFIFKPETYDPWMKKGMRIVLKLMFINVEVEGAEKVDTNQTYFFMSNHVSLFDIPVLAGYIPNFVRGIEADRQFKWPIYGTLVRRAGNIAISRTNIQSSIKSFKIAADRLDSGKSIIVLPEGHRTLTGEMREFKKLPFLLAKQSMKPIVPIGLSGLFKLKSKNSWLINPSTVKIKFGDPIQPNIMEEKSTVELRDYVKEEVKKLVEFL